MIVFLDTETTGLYPGQICQLSYIIQEGKSARAKNFFFKVTGVESGAFAVHGFSKEMLNVLSGGKVFADFIDEISGDLLSADVVVAHNYNFDCSFLREEFFRAGKVFCPKAQFCTMKNAVSVCKIARRGGGYKYPRLSELTEHYYLTDVEIRKCTEKLFNEAGGYHDARFDTSALYLAANCGIEEGDFALLKKYL